MVLFSCRTPAAGAGFAAIVEPHLRSMVLAARRILQSEDLAWDAVQETLLTLWREQALPPNLRAWLLRAVSNRSLHLRRCCSRCRKHEARAAALRVENCRCNDPSFLAENCELCAELDRVVAELPDEQRRIFILRERERLDYEAIAARLRIPLGTVRSRLNRARAALRVALRDRSKDD